MLVCNILYGVEINQATYAKCFGEKLAEEFQHIIDTKVTLPEGICIKYVDKGFSNMDEINGQVRVLIGVPMNWIQVPNECENGYGVCPLPGKSDLETLDNFFAVNPRLNHLKPTLLVYVEK